MAISDLFEPHGIAVIGASKTPGKLGNDAMTNVQEYDGDVYPVNPSSSGSVYGYDFVESVDEADANLALCCVPAPATPGVLEECGQAGIGAAVIFAGGFAEMNEEGEAMQQRCIDIADEYDMTLLGPNTAGYILPHLDLYSSFVPGIRDVGTGNVAVVAQSGGIGVTASFQLEREGYGVSGMFGLGNRANTGFADIIPYLDEDPNTDAIALHIEGTEDVDEMLAVCKEAETPIIGFKVGSEELSEFVESHTKAPTQSIEQYEEAFDRPGMTLVSSLTELVDASRAIATAPTPDGTNVGIVTAQAGPGIVLADSLLEAGANFPDLTAETRDRLDDLLLGITYEENPVDTSRPMPEFGEVIDAVARDENVDMVLVYEIYESSLGYPVDELATISEEVDKPVLFTVAGPYDELQAEKRQMEELGVPTFNTPRRGAQATAALVDFVSGSDD